MNWAVEALSRELMMFASIGFLIGGIDDLLIDLVYIVRRWWLWHRDVPAMTLQTLPPPDRPGRIVVFLPAWDEVAVIGQMLRAALDRFDHGDYRIYVGCYPNDRPTIDAVANVAESDARIRLVIGPNDGPTTKADCLNALWFALGRDEIASGHYAKAIVLHDAEDIVHPAELRIFDSLIERHAVVQLPVLPLVNPASRLISGHYADEFAEAHAKQLIVRAAIGAGLPLAGVGCAIARAALERIAIARDGAPFDAESLTEDYELGLGIAEAGGGGAFARIAESPGGPVVAVRAYFPATLSAAVRQKARWMTGIALAGWDRVGWATSLAIGDHWMRMRDRRAPLAILVLMVAYLALLAWALSGIVHFTSNVPTPPISATMRTLLSINTLLLGWRLAMRMAFTGRTYGWRESLWSVPRLFVGNYIALLAARRAIGRYAGMLRGAAPVWEKTAHEFPGDLGQADLA